MHFLISILKILLSTIIEKQIFCYQFPKQKKIYYHVFRRLIPFPSIRRLFYYHKGGFYHYDRYRKDTITGPAPIGGSPGTEPSERAKGADTQAHSDRGNSGKGAAGGTDDGAADLGGILITKNTKKRLSHLEGLRATGGRFFFPKGALTHHLVVAKSAYLRFRLWRKLRPLPCSSSPHKAGFVGTPFRRWYCCFASAVRSPRGMRLLREPMDNAALLRKCRHCPRRAQPFPFGNSCGPACENLPPAAFPQRWTACPHRPFSLLRKRNRKRNEVR